MPAAAGDGQCEVVLVGCGAPKVRLTVVDTSNAVFTFTYAKIFDLLSNHSVVWVGIMQSN